MAAGGRGRDERGGAQEGRVEATKSRGQGQGGGGRQGQGGGGGAGQGRQGQEGRWQGEARR
eukprot:2911536-Prymnesium_polylepis.1